LKLRRLWASLRLYLGVLLILFVLLVGGAAGYVLGTETGTRWLFTRVAPLVPGRLTVREVRGTLLGSLAVHGLHYRNASADIHLDALQFQWDPVRLLLAEVHIARLRVDGLHVAQTAQAPPSEKKLTLPAIPIPITVILEQAEVRDATFGTAGTTVLLSRGTATARAGASGVYLQSMAIEAPRLKAEVHGRLLPQGDYPLDLTLHWSATIGEAPCAGTGRLEGTLRRLKLTHSLTQQTNSGPPATVNVLGTIHLPDSAPDFDLHGTWKGLRWPLAGPASTQNPPLLQSPPLLESPEGTFTLNGRPEHYQFALEGALNGPQVPAGRWRLDGLGNARGITVQHLRGELLEGTLEAAGRVGWEPRLNWQVAVTGRQLNPGRQWPDWPGRLSVEASSDGELQPGLRLAIKVAKLGGELRGYPFSAETACDLLGSSLRLERFELRSGAALLKASGRLAEDWDLSWEVQAPRLESLLPAAKGTITGAGSMRGPRGQPRIALRFVARNVAVQDQQIADLKLNADLDLSDRADSRIDLTASSATVGGLSLNRIQVGASGKVAAHRVDVQIGASQGTLALKLTGRLERKVWQGRLAQAGLRLASGAAWNLEQPVTLDAGAEQARFQQACWRQGATRLCARGEWRKNAGWEADGRISGLPARMLGVWLPPQLSAGGDLDGEFRARAQRGALDGEAKLAWHQGRLAYQAEDHAQLALGLRHATLLASLRQGELTARADVEMSGEGGVHAALRVSRLDIKNGDIKKWKESAIQGELKARFTELGLVSAFVPAVADSRGVIDVNIAVAGTAGAPRVTGQAVLDRGAADVIPLGIRLQNLRLAVSSRGEKTLDVEGQAASGGGTTKVRGELSMDAGSRPAGHFTIQGQRFEALNIPQARVYVSPELTVEVQGKRIQLGGRVKVPEAQLTLKELEKGAVPVSEDVVIVGAGQGTGLGTTGGTAGGPAVPGWSVYSRIDVILGDKVSFKGLGLSAQVAGSLHLTDASGGLPSGAGELRLVNGKYEAYGQKLDISRGRLLFAGPVSNPGLDVRATRQVGEVTAGIRVGGTAQRPQADVFSDPAMPQADALSYLLVGHPLNQTSGHEGQLLVGAASALGLTGGEALAKRIGHALGIEDVALKSEGALGQTALVMGKYLSPKMYVSYGLGLFQRGNIVEVRYKVNPKLTIQVESGTQSGADLIYTIERK
jgi:translocation and assembly module TamB